MKKITLLLKKFDMLDCKSVKTPIKSKFLSQMIEKLIFLIKDW